MSIVRQLARGFRALFHPRDTDRDVHDELQHYLEQATAARIARGLPPDQAVRAARLELGNTTSVSEEVRTAGWEHMLETMASDVRYALRSLRRNRSFALVMILTLALSTGANMAIFSVAESVLLRPLPYPADDQLVQLWSTGGKVGASGRGPLSWQQVQSLGGLHRDLTGVAGFTGTRYNLTGNGDPVEVQAALASPSLFQLLGVQPALGRGFAPSDLHDPVVVLSHGLWLQLFGGDANAIGRPVTLDGTDYSVVGVMPADFAFPDESTQIWLPLGQAFAAQPELETDPDFMALNTIGRLRDGVDVRRLAADLSLVAAEQHATPGFRPPGFAAMRLRDEAAGDTRTPLLVLLAVAGFVLVIGCVNAAGLLLARSTARQREFAVRRALGAGRGRLMAQLLTESIVLALAGGAAGLLIAELGVSAILKAWPAVLPRTHQIGIDATTMGYALLISLLAGVAFGLAPAWRSSAVALDRSLREGSSGTTTGRNRHRLQRGLVVAEIALALVVLTGAGLLVRSFIRLRSVDPGYEVHGVLAARVRLLPARYATEAPQLNFFQSVAEELGRQPGVESASISRTLPMSGEIQGFRVTTRDIRPDDPQPYMDVDQGIVGPEFFRTMHIPLVAGRRFTDNDRANTQKVAIVNAALAKRLWPHESPIGRAWPLRGGASAIIVGEIGDIHYASLTDPVKPEAYLPFSQADSRGATSAWIVARATHDPIALAATVRTAIARVDPQQPVAAFTTLNELVGRSTAARSFNMTLVSIFALLALGLAVVGVYGVTAYTVQQRTQEIGVRIALGAAPGHVLGLVLTETGTMAVIGIVIGLAGAFGFTRVMGSLLYDVSVTDSVTFVVTTVGLAAAALVAALLPALRAARIDPVQALRSE
jgi:predicted permease